MLLTIALTSFLSSGCGESPAPPRNLFATPAQSVVTTSVAQTGGAGGSFSLHDRVMAERDRQRAAGAANRQPTATSESPPQSSATTSGIPSVEPDGTTTIVLTGGQTPLKGVWTGTAERLASYLLGIFPSPRFTVPASVLAEYYVRYSADAGLRADLLWAQMIHETGFGAFGGDVLPEQNNYAGIGATGGRAPGESFPTAEAGVIAHVAHMVAYVYASSPVSWASATTDPRFDFVNPRGVASVLADLNGRWAVPGTTYGESIEAIARAINSD